MFLCQEIERIWAEILARGMGDLRRSCGTRQQRCDQGWKAVGRRDIVADGSMGARELRWRRRREAGGKNLGCTTVSRAVSRRNGCIASDGTTEEAVATMTRDPWSGTAHRSGSDVWDMETVDGEFS